MASGAQPDYSALAAKYGGAPATDYTALAAKYGGSPQKPPDAEKPSLVSDALKYSPVGVVKGLADALRDPKSAVTGMLKGNEQLWEKAKDSYSKGDYTTAAAHFLNYLVPGGQAMDDAGMDFQKGEYAHGLAKTAGIASSVVAGAKAPQIMDAATNIPAKVVSAAQRGVDTIAAATDPEVVRAAIKVVPKGSAVLDAHDKFVAAKARFEAARAPVQPAPPVPVIRDSPAWSQFPDAAPNPGVTPVSPASALPSGRTVGGPAHAATIAERIAKAADAAKAESVDPVLNAVAQMQGHKDFISAPSEAQATIRSAAAKAGQAMSPEDLAAFTEQAAPQPAVAPAPTVAPPSPPVAAQPAPEPKLPPAAPTAANGKPTAASLAQQLRDEMLKNGTIDQSNLSVPDAPEPASAGLKTGVRDMMRDVADPKARKAIADANYAGDQNPEVAGAVYEAAARADKATKLAEALSKGGISAADAARMEPEHWQMLSKSLGIKQPPSKASIGETLFRMQRLEAATLKAKAAGGGR